MAPSNGNRSKPIGSNRNAWPVAMGLVFALLATGCGPKPQADPLEVELQQVARLFGRFTRQAKCGQCARLKIGGDSSGVDYIHIADVVGDLDLDIGPDLGRFKKLYRLEIIDAGLRKFPSFPRRTQFGEVSIDGNHFKNIHLDDSTSLPELFLSNNNIEHFTVGKGVGVKWLNLSYNDLRSLDGNIRNIRGLTYLSLSHNDISDFDLTGMPDLELVECWANPALDTVQIKKKHRDTKIAFVFSEDSSRNSPNWRRIWIRM